MNNYLTKKIISQLKFLMNSDERKNEYKEIFWPNFGSILTDKYVPPELQTATAATKNKTDKHKP
jgi:hypothetical protein